MRSKQENKKRLWQKSGLHSTNHKFSFPQNYSTANQKEERENISQKERKISRSKESTNSPITKAPLEANPKGFSQNCCENKRNKIEDRTQGLFENPRRSQETHHLKTKHLQIFTPHNSRGSRKRKTRSWKRKGYVLKIANLPKQQSTGIEISWQIDGTEN